MQLHGCVFTRCVTDYFQVVLMATVRTPW